MKKVFLLILTALMVLSAAGCGGETAVTVPETTQPAPVETQASEIPGAFLWGTWKNLGEGWTGVEFGEDGMCVITEGEDSRTVSYFFAGESVTVADEREVILRITEEEGILHLRRDALELDLVPEAHYDSFQIQCIEINNENWQEYFETRYITHYQVEAASGKLKYRCFGCGFILKEAYLDRLPMDTGSVDVTVTIRYDADCYRVLDPFSFDYVITDELRPYMPLRVDVIDKGSVVDRRDPHFGIPERSDLYGQVCAFVGVEAGFEDTFNHFFYYIMDWEQLEVLNVEGELWLMP